MFIFSVWSAASRATCGTPGDGRLAIIIDDLGYHLERGLDVAQIPAPLTLAIIPGTPHARTLATAGTEAGKELIVHMPMASAGTRVADPIALTEHLTDAAFDTLIQAAIASVPGARGMNNHMGSQLTANREAMQRFMRRLGELNMYFIDSRTTPATVAAETAASLDVPAASRAVFLDHERDINRIREQLFEAVRRARDEGEIIAIGHPYPETLALLRELLPLLPASVTLTPASQIAECRLAQTRTSTPLVTR